MRKTFIHTLNLNYVNGPHIKQIYLEINTIYKVFPNFGILMLLNLYSVN